MVPKPATRLRCRKDGLDSRERSFCSSGKSCFRRSGNCGFAQGSEKIAPSFVDDGIFNLSVREAMAASWTRDNPSRHAASTRRLLSGRCFQSQKEGRRSRSLSESQYRWNQIGAEVWLSKNRTAP